MSKPTITQAEFQELSKVMEPIEIIRQYDVQDQEPTVESTKKETQPIKEELTKPTPLNTHKPEIQPKIILITILILTIIGSGIWYYQYDQELNRYETIAAESYNNGLMKVKKNNKLALINESKKLINQDQYDEVKVES